MVDKKAEEFYRGFKLKCREPDSAYTLVRIFAKDKDEVKVLGHIFSEEDIHWNGGGRADSITRYNVVFVGIEDYQKEGNLALYGLGNRDGDDEVRKEMKIKHNPTYSVREFCKVRGYDYKRMLTLLSV